MHAISLLSALALVGSTFAAPVPDQPKVVVVTEWQTVYATQGAGFGHGGGWGGKSTKTASAVKTSTAKPTVSSTSAKPTSSAQPTSSKPTSTAQRTTAAATAQAAATSAAASSSSPAYMDIVNKWRGNMKLATLAFSTTLQANALKTANDGNGKMVHELNPGTYGQVLAPGTADNFEKVFVGGWLCEVPSTPGLNGICSTMSQGWAYNGQTGHNEILTSTKYTKIGCALAKGIWACDLAY